MTVKTALVNHSDANSFEVILNRKLEELQNNDVEIIDIKYIQQRGQAYSLLSALIIFDDEPLEDEDE